MDIVKGVFSTAGQFQIIIGQGTVNRVCGISGPSWNSGDEHG